MTKNVSHLLCEQKYCLIIVVENENIYVPLFGCFPIKQHQMLYNPDHEIDQGNQSIRSRSHVTSHSEVGAEFWCPILV